jgi:hypothetical protein
MGLRRLDVLKTDIDFVVRDVVKVRRECEGKRLLKGLGRTVRSSGLELCGRWLWRQIPSVVKKMRATGEINLPGLLLEIGVYAPIHRIHSASHIIRVATCRSRQ